MKISKAAREDFEFFSTSQLDMIGHEIGQPITDSPLGRSAVECWYLLDTHGQSYPCRESAVLKKAIRAKASWNLQVKLWAEAMCDPLILGQAELVDYCHKLPDWIFKATMRQAAKLFLSREGWLPRFLKLEDLKGQWWPPGLDNFDPAI